MQINIGDKLKLLIKEKGLEQKQVAADLNIKSPTFNGYVSNKREPSIATLINVARYFNISVDYLIGNSNIREPYLKHLSDELREFILEPQNVTYIELAKDIKEKTLVESKKDSYNSENSNTEEIL